MSNLAKEHKIASSYVRSLFTPTPVQINVLLLYDCGLACIYCDQNDGDNNSMPFSTFESIVNKADELHSGQFNLTGGETLDWDHIKDGVELLSERNFGSNLTTHCFSLDDKMAGDLGDAGLNVLNVSLDGLTGVNGSDKTLDRHDDGFTDRLKTLRKDYGIRVKLNSVMYEENMDQIVSLLEYAKSNGFLISLGHQVPMLRNSISGEKGAEIPSSVLESIAKASKKGFLAEPVEYFENPEFDCFVGKNRSLSVGPDGLIQYCFKTGTQTKKFDEFTKADYAAYLKELKNHIEACSPVCTSNCAYMGEYLTRHPMKAIKLYAH